MLEQPPGGGVIRASSDTSLSLGDVYLHGDLNKPLEDETASTDDIESDCLSEIRSTHDTCTGRGTLLGVGSSHQVGGHSSLPRTTSVDKSEHSDHIPTPAHNLLQHVPPHREKHHWVNYESLSFLRTTESPSDDEDEKSMWEDNTKHQQEESENDEDLEKLCCPSSKRIKLLGEGGFGQVWLVLHKRRAYAMKVFSKFDLVTDGAVESVLRERDIARHLHHPFICSLVASKQDENFVYMLQEYCAGGEMFSLLERMGGKLRESSARFYIACIADAIAFLHQKRIVYRDLKPENLMMDRLGYPQLIDFGCAKQFDREATNFTTLTLCGTPRFVSPEMIEPEKYGGGHSFGADYWALGILMYEMLMGRNPYEYDGMTETEVYESILDEGFQPSLADEHSPAAKDFLGKLLVHNPSQRLGRKNHDSRILQHRWFADVDLSSLRKKPRQTAPWSPDLSDSSDSHYFDDWEDVIDSKFAQSYPSLSCSQHQLFANF